MKELKVLAWLEMGQNNKKMTIPLSRASHKPLRNKNYRLADAYIKESSDISQSSISPESYSC